MTKKLDPTAKVARIEVAVLTQPTQGEERRTIIEDIEAFDASNTSMAKARAGPCSRGAVRRSEAIPDGLEVIGACCSIGGKDVNYMIRRVGFLLWKPYPKPRKGN